VPCAYWPPLIPRCTGSDDQIGTLRIAVQFFDDSIDTTTIKRGMGAYNNPDFYRQLIIQPELPW
jgi:hypothetical protein